MGYVPLCYILYYAEMGSTDHHAAYDALVAQLLVDISKVNSRDSARRFARENAKLVRREKRRVPEFYEAEFVSLFKDALVGSLEAETTCAEQAVADAKMDAQISTVELTARLEAATAAGDRDAQHSVWREREALQRAGQAKVDAASAGLGPLNFRLDAFERLVSALGVILTD